jgi:acetyl-CoA carboxylase biotin carboxyl carrier protein
MSEQRIKSELSGNVWKIHVVVGDKVSLDDSILTIESMKMEIPVTAPGAGTVIRIAVIEGDTVAEGQLLAIIGP